MSIFLRLVLTSLHLSKTFYKYDHGNLPSAESLSSYVILSFHAVQVGVSGSVPSGHWAVWPWSSGTWSGCQSLWFRNATAKQGASNPIQTQTAPFYPITIQLYQLPSSPIHIYLTFFHTFYIGLYMIVYIFQYFLPNLYIIIVTLYKN